MMPAPPDGHKRDGTPYVYVTMAEIERALGFRVTQGGTHARMACPIHGGDNRQGCEANFTTGWLDCRTRGCCGRIVADETERDERRQQQERYAIGGHRRSSSPRPRWTPPPQSSTPPPATITDEKRAALLRAIEAARVALPGSPGEHYLARRGITAKVIDELEIGWVPASSTSRLAGRVVFPLGRPEGLTSATGRLVAGDEGRRPKYMALGADRGYPHGVFNIQAITRAKECGRGVVIVEGPVDAAACHAGGVDAVALVGAEARLIDVVWLAGSLRVVLALDVDDKGRAALTALATPLAAMGVPVAVLPEASLEGCKDLGQFWEERGELPAALLALVGADPDPGNPSDDLDEDAPTRAWQHDDVPLEPGIAAGEATRYTLTEIEAFTASATARADAETATNADRQLADDWHRILAAKRRQEREPNARESRSRDAAVSDAA